MKKLKDISTASILEEMRKRDSRIKSDIYDAICILEKIKLIAYGFSNKYELGDTTFDKTQELMFLKNRRKMDTEMSVLTDYICELDTLINHIDNVQLKSDVA